MDEQYVNPYACSLVPRKPLSSLRRNEYQGLCFLVVDDNPDQQKIISMFLQRYQGQVEHADNGAQALQKYLENTNKYDIIFMDLQMPVMNGLECARQIRIHGGTTVIVAVSGDLDSGGDDKLRDFTCRLQKPFSMEQLATVIYQSTIAPQVMEDERFD